MNAARWLSSTAPAEFGTTRLLIGGESSGATLAVLTLLRLRGEVSFAAAYLAFGCYDMGLTTPSQRRAIGTPVIDRHYLETSRPLIFPGLSAEQRRDPAISPLYADLSGLPPALFTVGLSTRSSTTRCSWQRAGRSRGEHGAGRRLPAIATRVHQLPHPPGRYRETANRNLHRPPRSR